MINLTPTAVFEEYQNGVNFKNSIGTKGIFEQSDINERFYRGDQWYGADCGNQRPLVRHNIIKRIGEYKLSQILASPYSVKYSVNGITRLGKNTTNKSLKKKMSGFKISGAPANDEINSISEAMDKYYLVTAKRMSAEMLFAKAIKDAYIKGTGIIYTYWDSSQKTGTSKNNVSVKGDIKCEVLDVKNVYFGNPYEENVEKQPFIIITSVKETEKVLKEAESCGADEITLNAIKAQGKNTLVLTKLYKETDLDGNEKVMCLKVTENAVIRPSYSTDLRRYPIAVFRWEDTNNLIYGDSEITYLIPNQIAINRMITANVWSAVTMGMPLMLVNGDTIDGEITNDPGQIIKVFGTNEDVSGAVKYISPPDVTSNFGSCVNSLIETTLAQCGANEVALGDSRADNMSALNLMRNAATMPLNLVKSKYKAFVEDIALIWADFWITQYKDRKIQITDESGIWYMPFNGERYKNLCFTSSAENSLTPEFSSKESVELLTDLLQKGIISKNEYLKRLPKGLIPDCESLMDNNSTQKGEAL